MSSGADHTSIPTPTGTRGPENDPVSMGVPNIDERGLGHGVDDQRSTGTDETRSGAREHDGRGRDDKETRRNTSIAVGSAEIKRDDSPIPAIL